MDHLSAPLILTPGGVECEGAETEKPGIVEKQVFALLVNIGHKIPSEECTCVHV